jgi:hypothetical protein
MLGHAGVGEEATLLQTWDEWGNMHGLFESSIQQE